MQPTSSLLMVSSLPTMSLRFVGRYFSILQFCHTPKSSTAWSYKELAIFSPRKMLLTYFGGSLLALFGGWLDAFWRPNVHGLHDLGHFGAPAALKTNQRTARAQKSQVPSTSTPPTQHCAQRITIDSTMAVLLSTLALVVVAFSQYVCGQTGKHL